MPTVFKSGPYRFFFYASDRDEPLHIHVERDDKVAKYWVDPVRLHKSGGFNRIELNQIKNIIEKNQKHIMRHGMNILASDIEAPYAINVQTTEDTLTVDLSDGRTISVPLGWFPRLENATSKERNNWRLVGKGHGIHWEDIDEDISVEDLLAGKPSMESQESLKKWFQSRKEHLF